MPLSQPAPIFGIHSLTAYNILTREPLGVAKVLGSAELSSEGEQIPLNGGSSPYAWKVERGLITAELSVTLREYPDFLFETLLGKSITVNSAESLGDVSTIENVFGASTVAATGIATATAIAASEADLKFASYLVKVVSPTTVDIFATTDLDFAQNTPKQFVDDSLKINDTPLTITMGGTTAIPGFGVELTGGGGTIAMVPGDTAAFDVRPINVKSRDVVVGSSSEVFNDFGLVIAGQRQGDNLMQTLDCYRVSGSGLPINLTEKEFSEASVTMSLYRDTVRDGLYRFREVSSVN